MKKRQNSRETEPNGTVARDEVMLVQGRIRTIISRLRQIEESGVPNGD